MNNLYGGMITPHWNQIDKIHIGPANTFQDEEGKVIAGLDPNDEVLLGRYVLVKYLKDIVYSQDDRYTIINGSLIGKNAADWKKYYEADGNIDYDGVVFIKELYTDENDVTTYKYTPVARLNTSFSEDFVRNVIGFEKVEGFYPTVKEVTDNLDGRLNTAEEDIVSLEDRTTELETNVSTASGQITTLIDKDTGKSVREIAKEEVDAIVDSAPEAFDTLKEIAEWIATDKTGAEAMSKAIAQNTEDILTNTDHLTSVDGYLATLDRKDTALETSIQNNTTNIINLQQQVDDMGYTTVIEAETLPTDPTKIPKDHIYSIPVEGEQYRALYNIVSLTTGDDWNLLGYTQKAKTQITWEKF